MKRAWLALLVMTVAACGTQVDDGTRRKLAQAQLNGSAVSGGSAGAAANGTGAVSTDGGTTAGA
ncbi:MAG: hypothetical protein JWO22_3877, partial [Frankiales bacterium]|nr:hypothetical protein [Frankiales bacterium]